ncbi:MAG: aldose-1-epimerase [Ancrocorticia sp.]|uniref:aldose-1-epimerase n=1 Tax=Ancrocorticia sp. TaxID=2593684 RepID=UPI003F905741
MANLASGKNVILRAGDYEARVVAVGAGLAELTYGGGSLITSYGNDEFAPEYMGKVLIPWPNRVADGQYTQGGVSYQLPVNDIVHNAALHGFMAWVEWQVAEMSDTAVTFKALAAPRPGYPWTLRSTVKYELDSRSGLTVTVQTTNIGNNTAPYGVAAHPYIYFGEGTIDSYELTVPARTVTTMNANQIPTGTVPAAGNAHTEGPIGSRLIDDAYTDLPEDGWDVTVRDTVTGRGAIVSSQAPWVQIYSGDQIGRAGLAIEPMSCAPNAFNSGDELTLLAPGGTHRYSYAIKGIA